MDINALVSTFGFPIACAIVLGWFVYKIYNDSINGYKEREEKFYVELSRSREANCKFADIIASYTNKLDVIQIDVKDIREKIDKIDIQ